MAEPATGLGSFRQLVSVFRHQVVGSAPTGCILLQRVAHRLPGPLQISGDRHQAEVNGKLR